MLNTNVKATISNNIMFNNAASGVLQKSHARSAIKWLHRTSKSAESMFDNEPCLRIITDYTVKHIPIIVLQVLLMGNDYLLVEYVKTEDF